MKSVDLDKLNETLKNQILEDKKYWERNDAKFRAVEQRVGSYEEFRQMVLGAHLCPLNKNESISELHKTPRKWNALSINCDTLEVTESLPKSTIEHVSHFMTCWKKCQNVEDRGELLFEIGAERLGRFFQSDLRFDFFDEAIVALSGMEKRSGVVEILSALSGCRGFGLVVKFMSGESRRCCERLLVGVSDERLTKLYLSE